MCKKELPGSSADLVAYRERRSYCNNVKINATTGVCIKYVYVVLFLCLSVSISFLFKYY